MGFDHGFHSDALVTLVRVNNLCLPSVCLDSKTYSVI